MPSLLSYNPYSSSKWHCRLWCKWHYHKKCTYLRSFLCYYVPWNFVKGVATICSFMPWLIASQCIDFKFQNSHFMIVKWYNSIFTVLIFIWNLHNIFTVICLIGNSRPYYCYFLNYCLNYALFNCPLFWSTSFLSVTLIGWLMDVYVALVNSWSHISYIKVPVQRQKI